MTGGGFGIGRCICEGFAEFGADVVVADVNEETARETVELISRYGHRATAVKVDVANAQEVENMVQRTVAEVNNAGGIMGRYRIHETPEELWDRIMAINFKGIFLCTKAEIPVMLKQKKGSIINTASVGAILPGDPDMMGSVYDAAKAGVIVFSPQGSGRVRKRRYPHQRDRSRNGGGHCLRRRT